MITPFFFRSDLELSLQLLRTRHPAQAAALERALHELRSHIRSGEQVPNQLLVDKLGPRTIGKIIASLTRLICNALQQQTLTANHKSLLQLLISHWAQLTEWVIWQSAPLSDDKTLYH